MSLPAPLGQLGLTRLPFPKAPQPENLYRWPGLEELLARLRLDEAAARSCCLSTLAQQLPWRDAGAGFALQGPDLCTVDGPAETRLYPRPMRGDTAMLTTGPDGSYQWTAMHSPVSLHLPEVGQPMALAVARAVQADLEATEQALSRFRPSAELALLNGRVGDWTLTSPRLYLALTTALQAYRRTGGLFDPRILDRLEYYGYLGAPRGGETPPHRRDIWLERRPRDRSVRILAAVDLGGVGKGLGVRWGAGIARRVSTNFLLNAGGDLLAAGPGPEGRGWQVGIEDPHRPDDMIAALHLPDGGAVCTSSIAKHHWQHGGEAVHHLIDPRTGRPGGKGLLAVTVVGTDPAWTEVWSKALFLQGADAVAASRERAAVWVTEDGEFGMSEAAKPLVFWRAKGASSPAAP